MNVKKILLGCVLVGLIVTSLPVRSFAFEKSVFDAGIFVAQVERLVSIARVIFDRFSRSSGNEATQQIVPRQSVDTAARGVPSTIALPIGHTSSVTSYKELISVISAGEKEPRLAIKAKNTNPTSLSQLASVLVPPVIGNVRFASMDKSGKLSYEDTYVQGSFIIELDGAVTVDSAGRVVGRPTLNTTLEKLGGYTARKMFRWHTNSTDPLARFFVARMKNASLMNRIVLREIGKTKGVVSISPNYIAHTSQTTSPTGITGSARPTGSVPLIPNDPLFKEQWMHDKLQSLDAWEISKGNGTVIAVIDTGVDWTHEDLAGNIWKNADEIDGDGIDNDGNGYIDDVIGWDFVDTFPYSTIPQEDFQYEDNNPSDYYGHGTHVAGIVAAQYGNGKGVVGVCPGCLIMPLRAGYAPGYLEYADTSEAIVYAADNGARVINMSYGGSFEDASQKAALDYAYSKGVVLVAAAGNDSSSSIFYPAGHENVVAVTATDSADQKAWFSNYGYWTDVAAPGVDILSTVPKDGYYLASSYPPLPNNPAYAKLSGTSMASPVVAGIAGLLAGTQSAVNPPAVQSAIESGSRTFGQEIISQAPEVFLGSGRAESLQSLQLFKKDPGAIILIKESDLSATVVGDFSPTIQAIGKPFLGGSLYLGQGTYNYSIIPYTFSTLSAPLPGDPFHLNTGDFVANGKYTIFIGIKGADGQVVRKIQKQIDVKNIELADPFVGSVFNPNNGSITFTGTIANNLTSYTFAYKTNSMSTFSGSGFAYPGGNTTKKINKTLAVWTIPAPLIGAGDLQIQITVNMPGYPPQTAQYQYFYDTALKKGWPLKISAPGGANPSWPVATAWDSEGDGSAEIAFEYFGGDFYNPTWTINALKADGTFVAGWPKVLSSQTTDASGKVYYLQTIEGGIASVGNVDADLEDELIVHGIYSVFPSFEHQSGIYAFNQDGSIVSGFPIFTSHAVTSSFLTFTDNPAIIADLNNDGDNEIIVRTADGGSDSKTLSLLAIASKNAQGKYVFSSFPQNFPSSEVIWLDWFWQLNAELTVQNIDGDADKEIIFTRRPLGKCIPSCDAWVTTSGLSYISAVNRDGTSVPGWPVALGSLSDANNAEMTAQVSSVVIDGAPYVAGATYRNYFGPKAYLFDKEGNIVNGWPHDLQELLPFVWNSFPGTPIVGDISGDEKSDIVFPAKNAFFGFLQDGSLIADGSIPVDKPDFHNPILILKDQSPELLGASNAIFGENTSYIASFDPMNSASPDILKAVSGSVLGPPLLLDLNNDKIEELVAISTKFFSEPSPISHFFVHVWDLPTNITKGSWPMFMHDSHRTNNVGTACLTAWSKEIPCSQGAIGGGGGKLFGIMGYAPANGISLQSTFGSTKIESVKHGAYGPSPLWVASGDAGKTAWSTDGLAWQAGASGFGTQSIFGFDEGYLPGQGVGLWVMVGGNGKIAVSLDGKTWSSITNSTFGTTNIRAVDYSSTGLAGSSGLWVAVGGAGKLATSEDGLNWTQRPTGVPQSILYTVKHNGLPNLVGSRWIAAGENGKVLSSFDGIAWSEVADLGDFIIQDVDYFAGTWVLVGGKGKIYTSTNGITWIERTSGFGAGEIIYTVVHNQLKDSQGMWIAGGENGKMTTSKDGIIWITSTSSFGTSDILDVAF
jgi:hypothetical protein